MRQRPLLIYQGYCLLVSLLRATYFTAAIIYYITVVGLNPFQFVFVGTTLMVTILLGEVPTGVVADVFSRRLSIIIGLLLVGVGFILEASIPSFEVVLLSQVVWGLGLTFTSGALEAWIADEQGGAGLERIYLRGGQLASLGELLGICLGIGLAQIFLTLPMFVGGIGHIVWAVVLAAVMPETGWQPRPRDERASWQAMSDTLRAGATLVRRSWVLLIVMGVTFFAAMASESFDRLWEVHFLNQIPFPAWMRAEPVTLFGTLSAIALVMSIITTEAIQRWLARSGEQALTRALLAVTTLIMLGMVAFGLASAFGVGVLAFWLTYLLRRVYGPLYVTWLNRHATSEVRATVNSLAGQVDAVGQIAGGPLFGLLATTASTGTAMVTAGAALLPALLLFLLLMARERAGAAAPVGAAGADG